MYCEHCGLRVVEPLNSLRLGDGYWKGVGNIALLNQDQKFVSLRVSHKVASSEAISAVVSRMESAVDKGYTVISGFIPPGERFAAKALPSIGVTLARRYWQVEEHNRPDKPQSSYL